MNERVDLDEAREVQRGHFDPYQLDPSHVLEPPTSFGEIIRKTGPGIVLAASIVGSGELILTTTLGAKVGYVMLWLIILSCLIKAVVQSFLGRYTIATAETSLTRWIASPARATKSAGWYGFGLPWCSWPCS